MMYCPEHKSVPLSLFLPWKFPFFLEKKSLYFKIIPPTFCKQFISPEKKGFFFLVVEIYSFLHHCKFFCYSTFHCKRPGIGDSRIYTLPLHRYIMPDRLFPSVECGWIIALPIGKIIYKHTKLHTYFCMFL